MNGTGYSSRDAGRSREHHSSRHDRDDRRDRDRDRDRERDRERGDRRDGQRDRDRERRRSRSPHGRSRRDYDTNAYSDSRDYRNREREDRYAGGRRDDNRGGDWGRDRRPPRRDDTRGARPSRDLFDDRRGGGRRPDRDQQRGMRDDDDEIAAQEQGKKVDSPSPKKREPTPDLSEVVPILARKRRLTQWDIKPPGYENITAEQAKLSGMFPLPGAPRSQMDASKLQAFINQPTNLDKSALKPSTARQSKRLFVRNIPAGTTEETIVQWFNLQLNGLNVVESRDPCVSVNISKDRTFAVVEFKAPADATMALALDGESMEAHLMEANGSADGGAQGFSITRPNDYIVPSPEEDAYQMGSNGYSTVVPDSEHKISIANVPTFLGEDQIVELVSAFGELKAFVLVKDNETQESKGVAFVEFKDVEMTKVAVEGLNGTDIGDKKLKVSLASIGARQASDMEMSVTAMSMFAGTQSNDFEETRVLQLLNMVTAEELIDNDEYEEICEDIREECQKYGTILDMKIPRPVGGSRQSAGVGKIYVKFETTESAKKALQSLAGRKFADRTVVTTFFDEPSFEVNAW